MASSRRRRWELTPCREGRAASAGRPQRPGIGVVGEGQLEDLEQPALELGVVDRREDLDAAVEVPFHQVG